MSQSRAHSPASSWLWTAARAPGTRSTGPCAAVPESAAITPAIAAIVISAVAIGLVKRNAGIGSSDTSRAPTPTNASAMTK